MTPRRAVVAGVTVLWGAVLLAGLVTSGYRPWEHTVSWLGSPGQPHVWILRAGLVLHGALVVAGAAAIAARAVDRQSIVRGLVVVYGLMGVLAGIAPKDLPDTPHTITSQLHVLATVVGGGVLIVAMVVVATSADGTAARRGSVVSATLGFVGVLAFRLSWGTAVHGAAELVVLACGSAWLVALALGTAGGARLPSEG